MSRRVKDDADVLFGPGNGNNVPIAEAELIFAMLATELTL